MIDKWISVEDRLPDYYKPVLVICNNTPSMNIVWLASDGDRYFYTELNSDRIISNVTHWMPLPEPPQTTTN